MFVSTLLAAMSIISAVASCDMRTTRALNLKFTQLSNAVITHDDDMFKTCKQFRQYPTMEFFREQSYRIEVMLPGYDSANFDVRIKHRVIYINGHVPRRGGKNNCDLTFVDIKVLPHFADTHAASWIYSNSKLIVAMPHRYKFISHDATCSRDIDETLIYVPRGYPSNDVFYA